MLELFIDILDYEGMYQVSNLGRIKSLKWKEEKFLTPVLSTTKYYTVLLWKNNKPKCYKIHQLVAIAFLGHTQSGFTTVVDHIDFNKLNNRIDNLRLVTARENTSHKKVKGTSKYTGVTWHKRHNKWVSSICIKGKTKHLGYFIDELEAHNAYQTALKTI